MTPPLHWHVWPGSECGSHIMLLRAGDFRYLGAVLVADLGVVSEDPDLERCL